MNDFNTQVRSFKSSTETEHSLPSGSPKFRYLVQHILVSEMAEWERHNEDIFVEQELARLAEKGDIHFLLPDGDGDIKVILWVPVTESEL